MTSKLRLDLTFALPELPDAADACVHRLVADLQAQPGIDHVHIHPRPAGQPGSPAALCIHYDAASMSLARIREIVKASGVPFPGASAICCDASNTALAHGGPGPSKNSSMPSAAFWRPRSARPASCASSSTASACPARPWIRPWPGWG